MTARGRHVAEADRGFWLSAGPLARLLTGGRERFLARVDKGLEAGRLTVTLPGGDVRTLGGRGEGPEARLHLKSWRAVLRLAAGGSAGWARAYFEGEWDAPDRAAFFDLMMRNRRTLGGTGRAAVPVRWMGRMAQRLRENTPQGSRENISFHYDLGNDFYAAWLDETMSYSSAIFGAAEESLEAAQRRKIRTLLDRLDMKPGERLLEIGCGWGALAEIAARDYGVRVTGITLSAEQYALARERAARAGLADRIEIRLVDYREVAGRFDHVASVEMFEAVGERYWQTYMDRLAALLRPGGRAAIQVITIDEAVFPAYRAGADFIQTYIFPGGLLPSEPRFRAAAERAGLVWQDRAAYGAHYAETLGRWHARYDAARRDGRIPAGFDERFDSIWRYYLDYCEGGFRSGGIDVIQAVLQK